MTRTAIALTQQGCDSAIVDLSQLAADPDVEPEQWFFGIAQQCCQRIASGTAERLWHESGAAPPASKLGAVLRHLATTANRPLVVFFDEIDSTIPLAFTDPFFVLIRQLHNARANETTLKNLTFVLLGVATPADLVKDFRITPFNIGELVELGDFTAQEARVLAAGLVAPSPAAGEVALERILYWTGGHPYLTQRLCYELTKQARTLDAQAVDAVVERVFLSPDGIANDANLGYVKRGLLEKQGSLLASYRRLVDGAPRKDNPRFLAHARLKLLGIVTSEHSILRVRNRIYERVFSPEWARSETTVDRRLVGIVSTVVLVAAVMATIYAKHRESVDLEEDLRALKAVSSKDYKDPVFREVADLYPRIASRGGAPAARDALRGVIERRLAMAAAQEDADYVALYGSMHSAIATGGQERHPLAGSRSFSRLVATEHSYRAPSISESGTVLFMSDPGGGHLVGIGDGVRLPVKFEGPAKVAVVSPRGDGIAILHEDGSATRGRTVGSQVQWARVTGDRRGPGSCLAVSADGTAVVSGVADGDSRAYIDGARVPLRHKGQCSLSAVSGDGVAAVVTTEIGTFLYDLVNPRLNPIQLRGAGRVILARFLERKRLLTVSDLGKAIVWSGTDGTALSAMRQRGAIVGASLSDDGRLLAMAGRRHVTLWDVDQSLLQWAIAESEDVRLVSVSPTRLATVDEAGWVRVYQFKPGSPPTPVCLPLRHGGAVTVLKLVDRGASRYLVSSGRERTASSDRFKTRFWELNGSDGYSAAVRLDGPARSLEVGREDVVAVLQEGTSNAETIQLWDLNGRKMWAERRDSCSHAKPPAVRDIGVSENGTVVAAVDRRGCVTAWDRSGRRLAAKSSGLPQSEHVLPIVMPGGMMGYLVTTSNGRVGWVGASDSIDWDQRYGAPVTRMRQVSRGVLIATSDRVVRLVDTRGETLKEWRVPASADVTAIAEIREKSAFVAATADGQVFFLADSTVTLVASLGSAVLDITTNANAPDRLVVGTKGWRHVLATSNEASHLGHYIEGVPWDWPFIGFTRNSQGMAALLSIAPTLKAVAAWERPAPVAGQESRPRGVDEIRHTAQRVGVPIPEITKLLE